MGGRGFYNEEEVKEEEFNVLFYLYIFTNRARPNNNFIIALNHSGKYYPVPGLLHRLQTYNTPTE